MKNIFKLFFTLFFAASVTACGQNFFPTVRSGGTITMQGRGSFGGYQDNGRLYRFNAIPTGNYGYSGYFNSVTSSGSSQLGLGLISDRTTLFVKGKSKCIFALFENGGVSIKHRPNDDGLMSNVAYIPNIPLPAHLKLETNGNAVTFSYSTSPSNAASPTWVAIGTYANVLTSWTNTRKTLVLGSTANTNQTAVISNVNNYSIGSGQYTINSISVAQSPSDVTRFKITPNESNRPAGDVNYTLTIKDANNNVVYNDPNIVANTANYPTIDFTPSYANYTPHVTSAGTYSVCLAANNTACQSVTFTNANLGITSGGGGGGVIGSSSVLSYNNNNTYTSPAPNRTAAIKYIASKSGQNNWNGSRFIDLSINATNDTDIHRITITKASPHASGYSALFVDGTLFLGSDFIVRTGEVHHIVWLYGSGSYTNDLFTASCNTASLVFNVTKNN